MIQPTDHLVRIDVLGVADARSEVRGVGRSGVSVIVEQLSGGVWPTIRVIAVGSAEAVDAHEAARAPGLVRLARPGAVLIPGMVNAHTHLDLTHIGPRPHDPEVGFVPWIEMIRRHRQGTAEEIASSISRGVELSLKAGVVAVGDIAGAVGGRASLAGFEALQKSPMAGVSFVEFFALGRGEQRGLDGLREAIVRAEAHGALDGNARLRLGIQPHAPYSVSPAAFREAVDLIGKPGPICTHLAESIEEHTLIEQGGGPFRGMLEQFGLWTEAEDRLFGAGRTPVGHIGEELLRRTSVLAHVNDATDDDLAMIHRAGASVAYCPRASAYFGAARHFGPHRYRDMLAMGINVALGTDSIVNLPSEAATAGISVLDEMRFLRARDGTDAATLLAMGTVNGARALGMSPSAFQIRAGEAVAGLVCVPIDEDSALAPSLASAVMDSHAPAELLTAGRLHG